MKQIMENGNEQWKLEKGDCISIRWFEYGGPGYAYNVRYVGRTRKGEYKFQSTIYGWHYIVSKDKRTMYNDYHDEDIYRVDPSTGWTKYLPD